MVGAVDDQRLQKVMSTKIPKGVAGRIGYHATETFPTFRENLVNRNFGARLKTQSTEVFERTWLHLLG